MHVKKVSLVALGLVLTGAHVSTVDAALAVNQGLTVGPDFLGLFLGAFGTSQPAGLLGMSDMATMGQGYHAVQVFYFNQAATMIEVIPNRNAMLRVPIDLIPVELMGFEIE